MKDHEQEQQLGDGSQGYLAGRDNNVTYNVTYGVSEERLQVFAQQIEKDSIALWEKNAPKLVKRAKDEFFGRALEITRDVISNVIQEDPEYLAGFAQARAQVALLKAQESFGETGNRDVFPHLSRSVTQLITSEPQSYTEMISRRCIECLTNMTSSHLNFIAVNAKLDKRWFPWSTSPAMLIKGLTATLSPYFNKVPAEAIEYSYIFSLGVGQPNHLSRFANALTGDNDQSTIYGVIRSKNPHALYGGFTLDELPEAAKSLDIEKYLLDDDNSGRRYLSFDFAHRWVRITSQYSAPELPENPGEAALVKFCLNRIISTQSLKDRISESAPELATLLDTVERFDGFALDLNPVGLMLAAQEETLRTGIKSDLFEDLDLAQKVIIEAGE